MQNDGNGFTMGMYINQDSLFEEEKKETGDTIHIRLRQRNARKTITVVEGLSKDMNLDAIVKRFKKEMGCNGTKKRDKEERLVLQFQGNQCSAFQAFLIREGISSANCIKNHSFQ